MSGDFAFFDFRSPLVVDLLRVSLSKNPAVGGGMRGMGEDFSPALLSSNLIHPRPSIWNARKHSHVRC